MCERKKAAVLSAADRSDIWGNGARGVQSQRSMLASSHLVCAGFMLPERMEIADAPKHSQLVNSPRRPDAMEPSFGAYLSVRASSTPLLLGSFNLHGCRTDRDVLYVRFDSPNKGGVSAS